VIREVSFSRRGYAPARFFLKKSFVQYSHHVLPLTAVFERSTINLSNIPFMNKIFLLALLLLAGSTAWGQAAQPVSVFFETDRAELSPESRQTLDAIIPMLLRAADYQVNIEAFTDDRGTTEYNYRLAASRADAVQQYLAENGLMADKSVVKNWGKQKATNTSESGRQQNRRVDVLINIHRFDDYLSLQKRLSANTGQVLRIQNNREQTLTAAKGTLVIVPANAFVFENGTVPAGPVDIVVQEAFDPSDFILHNLTTTSGGRILQTGGMVSVTALSDGRALRLADGVSLTVSIPDGGRFDPAMELFYAQPTANGGVDWRQAGQKFRRTRRPIRTEINIDPELGKRIAAIKVPEHPKPSLPVFKGQMPPEPQMPKVPYKPRAPRKPSWDETQMLFAGGGSTVLTNRKAAKKAKLYYEEQLRRFERDSAKYVQLEQRYLRNLEGYEKAKNRYVQVHEAWVTELKTRLNAIAEYRQEMSLHYYSKALASTVKSKAKTIEQYETYVNLAWAVEEATNELAQKIMLRGGFSDDKKQRDHEMGKIYENIIGLKVMDGFKDYQKLSNNIAASTPTDKVYRARRQMLDGIGIKEISDSLRTEIMEKNLRSSADAGQLNATMPGYVASISQLGWINCDRFYEDPAEKMQVVVNEQEEATLYAVCKDISAMLPFQRADDGRFVVSGLPKGKKITVVAIKIKDGVPQYAEQQMRVGDAAPAMVYRSMPLRELKTELQKLNS